MAQSLGQMAVGSIVKLKEDGTSVNYIVVNQGRPSSSYDTSCDGTWLLRRNIAKNRVWDSGNSNVLESSDIQSYLNGTWINRYDTDIRNAIKQVKIPYRQNGGSSGTDRNGANGLSCKIFLLSGREVGWDSSDNQYFPNDGAKLDYFIDGTTSSANNKRIANLNGSATYWWLRSPHTYNANNVWRVRSNGNYSDWDAGGSGGVRPALVLPSTLLVSDDGSITTNTAPTAPENLTVPNQADKGGSVAISWSASTDADENLSGYTLQRSVNGGGFTQVYQGANTSFTDTAPTNADTLQYRVQAYDSEGATSGWTTSTQFPVYGIPTLTVPQMVMQGQSATISWSAVEGADSYTLQRKSSADADWTQVYSGANLSYTETVGTWTSLQYRVQAVFDETPGGWATSGDIQIVAASTLVISGTDGDLGTLTSDAQYSIFSDQTGNTISVVVEINGGEYAEFTATSGQTYSVGVLDLPTGTGNIVITATTTVSSSPVTVTRTWTYSKTAQSFPNSGSVATLTQEGNVVYPETLVEAVRASMTPWGGNLSTALDLLSRAALYNRTQTPKYNEVTISLSGKTEGQIIQLPENGKMVEFYVAKLDYESVLNGAGKVLLVRKNCYDQRAWDAGSVNAYSSSDLDTWLNGTYKNLLDSSIQTAIGTTKFYYTPGNGNNTVNTLERAVFTLSATELGQSASWFNVEGSALSIANTLKIAYLNGNSISQWTRSPGINSTNGAIELGTNGIGNANCNNLFGSRPCFTLPSTFSTTYYVNQSGTIQPSQEYISAGSWLDVWGNAIPAVKIETGSYVGTGTYGKSNPNTLTFSFKPKVVLIGNNYNTSTAAFPMVYPSTSFKSILGYSNTMEGEIGTITWSDLSMSWYATSAFGQMNTNGYTYYYIAIG